MQLLKILLLLLLVFFPFGELIRFDIGNNIILEPLEIVGLLIFFWTTVLYIKNKTFRSSLKWYFFVFPVVGLLSLGINSYWLKTTELLASFLYLVRWISYMSIFFAVIQLDRKFKDIVKKFLVVDGLLVLLFGYVQFFFYSSLQNLFYQGWDNHLYRMFSTFLDPNFIGAFFVLYLIFIAGFIFQSPQKSTRIFFLNSIVIVLTMVAVFLTYSRSALLMLITSGITFFVFLQKKIYIVYLLAIIFIFIILASPFFYIENVNLFRSYSSLERISDIQKGITIFKDHPLIGVGFDSYRYAQYAYHYEYNFLRNPPVHSASGTDNSFIFVLATTGVIGFVAYCYLWFQLIKKVKNRKEIYSVVFISSVVGLFLNSFFNNSLFYGEIMVWMWFITGFAFE